MTRILFVSSFHPDGTGNIGAGEAISGNSIRRLLATGSEVHVLCVVPGYQRASEQIRQSCASYKVVPHTPGQSVLAIIWNIFGGALFAPWFFTRVAPKGIEALRDAVEKIQPDEIWFDFPSSLGFVRHVMERPKVYFAHDLVSQKIRRSLLKRFLSPVVCKIEQGLLSRLSRLVVLSNKDRELAISLGFHGEIDVWPPVNPRVGIVDDSTSIETVIAQFGDKQNMVFFGHMGRAENHWSMVLFILNGYGKIRKSCPDARLWIIGVKPRILLKLLGKVVPGVEVVGPVDDPAKAFARSTVCIAPILFGAGVKIKVLQMLDAGGRVVATPIGAEGIATTERLTITDWSDLAAKIVGVMNNTHVDA